MSTHRCGALPRLEALGFLSAPTGGLAGAAGLRHLRTRTTGGTLPCVQRRGRTGARLAPLAEPLEPVHSAPARMTPIWAQMTVP